MFETELQGIAQAISTAQTKIYFKNKQKKVQAF